MLYETVSEYNRSGEFVRIFPCKGSKPYEKFVSGAFGTRMVNRLVHRVLYSNDILPYERVFQNLNVSSSTKALAEPKRVDLQKNLKYELEGVPDQDLKKANYNSAK